jgi:hypothetical protein
MIRDKKGKIRDKMGSFGRETSLLTSEIKVAIISEKTLKKHQ